jgi:hypothetical protein
MTGPLPPSRSGAPASRRAGRVAAAGVLLTLLTGLVLMGPQASLSVFWRLAVLSFDDPLTQALDELALGQSPFRDALGELLDDARLAGRSWRRAPAPAPARWAAGPLASDRAGRAPPLA